MNDNELIKQRVRKLFFLKAISERKQFVIPAYQRGYKWNRDDIFKLLEDLKVFGEEQ